MQRCHVLRAKIRIKKFFFFCCAKNSRPLTLSLSFFIFPFARCALRLRIIPELWIGVQNFFRLIQSWLWTFFLHPQIPLTTLNIYILWHEKKHTRTHSMESIFQNGIKYSTDLTLPLIRPPKWISMRIKVQPSLCVCVFFSLSSVHLKMVRLNFVFFVCASAHFLRGKRSRKCVENLLCTVRKRFCTFSQCDS